MTVGCSSAGSSLGVALDLTRAVGRRLAVSERVPTPKASLGGSDAYWSLAITLTWPKRNARYTRWR
jgi:hypothetical protein